MKYEIVTSEQFDGTKQDHIVIDYDDNCFESFPVDETNPRYIQFQADLAAEQPAPKAGK